MTNRYLCDICIETILATPVVDATTIATITKEEDMAINEAFDRLKHNILLTYDKCSTSQDRLNLIAHINEALDTFKPTDLSLVKMPLEVKTKGRPKMLKGARSSSAFEYVEKELAKEHTKAKKDEKVSSKEREKGNKNEKIKKSDKAKGMCLGINITVLLLK